MSEDKYFAVLKNQIDFFKPRVTSDTVLTKETNFVCKDIDIIAIEPVPEEFMGLSKEELVAKFSGTGWKVTFNDSKSLFLTGQSEQLCPRHKNYRHLGLFQDRLAIYEGPLGYNEKIIRVESIAVEELPNELQIRLKQAMDFQKQAGLAAEKLRNELEFKNEEVLNAVLENIDEHSEKQY
jgi:hypothetical protein